MTDLTLQVQVVTAHPNLPEEDEFHRWSLAALANRVQTAQITVRIVDAAESEALNFRYRHKAGPTNVLSFNYQSPEEQEAAQSLIGDLVLCAPVVAEEARQRELQLADHYAHLVVHGTLHLLGYDHEQEAEALDMEALEAKVLAQLGYANPYEEE